LVVRTKKLTIEERVSRLEERVDLHDQDIDELYSLIDEEDETCESEE
jgi:uncharacterized coiled-coil protein SlyX